jgi:hypothetical protein
VLLSFEDGHGVGAGAKKTMEETTPQMGDEVNLLSYVSSDLPMMLRINLGSYYVSLISSI